MKKLVFFCSLSIILCLTSCCKNDDDGGSGCKDDPTLVGTWTLERVTPATDENTKGCGDKITTLKFTELPSDDGGGKVVTIVSLPAFGECKTDTTGIYTPNGDVLSKESIPPPKNSFTLVKECDRLTLTTKEQNIVYEFVKN